jgi:predicted kinase
MKHLFLMCGIAGSGKSTYLSKIKNAAVISRDEIRFSLIGDFDDYFAKEDKVFATFIQKIQEAIDNNEGPNEIYCDATHLTKKSRDKVLNALDLTNVENITVLVVRPSLSEALRRNALRSGRRYVPPYVIRRMWAQFERPEEDENRIFDVKYVEVPSDE